MSQLFLPTQLASVLRFNDSCSPTAFKCLLTFLCPSSPGREEDALVFKVRKGGLGEGKRPAPDTLRGVAVGPQVQRSCVCCSIRAAHVGCLPEVGCQDGRSRGRQVTVIPLSGSDDFMVVCFRHIILEEMLWHRMQNLHNCV